MKYVLLGVAVLAIYPAARIVRGRPQLLAVLAAAVGLLPFLGWDQLNIGFAEVETYRGWARGFEVSLLDLVAATLWFALPPGKEPPPFRLPRYFYLAVAVFSVALATVPLYSWFGVWNILRAFFLLGVVVRLCRDPVLLRALVSGLSAGVLYSAGMSLKQRYVDGYYQVTGGYDHSNTLGMSVNLVSPIALALLLEARARWFAVATMLGAALCIILALSRGALLMFVAAVGIVFVGSILRRMRARKVYMAIALVVAGGLVLAKSADSIIERFVTAPEASLEARDRFEAAASMMVSNDPLGIGLNQYSHELEHGGYADALEMPAMDRNGLAHHIYWLTIAELGWLGLVAYLVMVLPPWWVAVRGAWRDRVGLRGDLLLGCAAGMTVMHVHGLAEWIALQMSMLYLFWTVVGIVVALDRRQRAMGEARGKVSATR